MFIKADLKAYAPHKSIYIFCCNIFWDRIIAASTRPATCLLLLNMGSSFISSHVFFSFLCSRLNNMSWVPYCECRLPVAPIAFFKIWQCMLIFLSVATIHQAWWKMRNQFFFKLALHNLVRCYAIYAPKIYHYRWSKYVLQKIQTSFSFKTLIALLQFKCMWIFGCRQKYSPLLWLRMPCRKCSELQWPPWN